MSVAIVSEEMGIAHQAHDEVHPKCPLCLRVGAYKDGQDLPIGRVIGINPPQTVEISEW